MGRRGPPRQPKKLAKAKGTYQKCRYGDRDDGEPLVVAPGAPPMPANLPPRAREIWIELVPQLLEQGTLAVVDGGALETYCREYARWSELDAAAAKKPLIKTPFGPKLNPCGEEARKLMKDILLPLSYNLVLHNAARNRVKLPAKEKPPDETESFLFGLKVIDGGKAQDPGSTNAPDGGSPEKPT